MLCPMRWNLFLVHYGSVEVFQFQSLHRCNSSVDCSISLKFDTVCSCDVIQFKHARLNGQRLKSSGKCTVVHRLPKYAQRNYWIYRYGIMNLILKSRTTGATSDGIQVAMFRNCHLSYQSINHLFVKHKQPGQWHQSIHQFYRTPRQKSLHWQEPTK